MLCFATTEIGTTIGTFTTIAVVFIHSHECFAHVRVFQIITMAVNMKCLEAGSPGTIKNKLFIGYID